MVLFKIPIGLFDNFEYTEKKLDILNNEKIFLYTDGVTEAGDKDEILYSDQKLLDCVSAHFECNPKELICRVTEDVAAHVKGNQRSDDLTMLCLEREMKGLKGHLTHVNVVPTVEYLYAKFIF